MADDDTRGIHIVHNPAPFSHDSDTGILGNDPFDAFLLQLT